MRLRQGSMGLRGNLHDPLLHQGIAAQLGSESLHVRPAAAFAPERTAIAPALSIGPPGSIDRTTGNPIHAVTDPGKDGFEASAEGDIDGDGKTSLFTRTGKIVKGQLILSPEIFISDETE